MSGTDARLVPITVHAYAGHKAEETPREFDLQGHRIVIDEIVDRWYQAGRDPTLPSSSYFKVRSEDAGQFLIKRDNETMQWFLVL